MLQAARNARDFERQDTREEAAARALGRTRKPGHDGQHADGRRGAAHAREDRANQKVAADVGAELWNEVQQEPAKVRSK